MLNLQGKPSFSKVNGKNPISLWCFLTSPLKTGYLSACYHFNYAVTFFNYTRTLGCVSCAASANSPIQDWEAGEEHLIKKGCLSVAFTDPTLVS